MIHFTAQLITHYRNNNAQCRFSSERVKLVEQGHYLTKPLFR